MLTKDFLRFYSPSSWLQRHEGTVAIFIAVSHEGFALRPETYENKKPQISQMTQIFFLRVPSCNFVANFLVIFIAVPL